MLDDEERTSISNVGRLYSTNAASDCCYTVGDNGESFFYPTWVYLDYLTRGGDLRSLRGWPCQRGRSKFKCDTNVHCVNDKQYMKYIQPLD